MDETKITSPPIIISVLHIVNMAKLTKNIHFFFSLCPFWAFFSFFRKQCQSQQCQTHPNNFGIEDTFKTAVIIQRIYLLHPYELYT